MQSHERAEPELPGAGVPRSKFIPALDGLRAFAILLIFGRHYFVSQHSTSPIVLLTAKLAVLGWVGVDLFFVLSGFLITGILWDSRSSPHYFRNFYGRRFLRIFPLYYAVLFFTFIVTFFHGIWTSGYWSYFAYLNNIVTVFVPASFGVPPYFNLEHFWSLAVEEQFYLLWPLVVHRTKNMSQLIAISAGLCLVSLFLRFALIAELPSYIGSQLTYKLLFTRMDSLLVGGLLALAVRSWFVSKKTIYVAALVSAVALSAVLLSAPNLDFAPPVTGTVGYTLLAVAFAGVVLAATEARSVVSAVCSAAVLQRLGRISYGFYVYHLWLAGAYMLFVMRPLQRLAHSVQVGGLLYVAFVFVATCAIASLSFRYLESPFLKLKGRFADSPAVPKELARTQTASSL